MSEKPPLYEITPLPEQAKVSSNGQIVIPVQACLADEEIAAIKRQEAERILTAFSIEVAASTMYQTDQGIHWLAGELTRAMHEICGIDVPDTRPEESERK